MRKTSILALVLMVLAALILVVVIGTVSTAVLQATAAPGPQPIENATCGDAVAAQVRTTLYFGTTRPTGAVSELEWQVFLRDEVTQRFPEGLTVWDAQGQWRTPRGSIDQERSKVLLLVHRDTAKARAAVQEVIEGYRKAFQQESVLWETARVCASS
jgi:hypothetical protein